MSARWTCFLLFFLLSGAWSNEEDVVRVIMSDAPYVGSSASAPLGSSPPNEALLTPAPCAAWSHGVPAIVWIHRLHLAFDPLKLKISEAAYQSFRGLHEQNIEIPCADGTSLAEALDDVAAHLFDGRGWRVESGSLFVWGADGEDSEQLYVAHIMDGSMHATITRILSDFGYRMGAWRFGGDDLSVPRGYVLGLPFRLDAVLDQLTRSYDFQATINELDRTVDFEAALSSH